MKIHFITAILLAFLLISCDNKIEKTINGFWTIDTAYYKLNDVKNCLTLNIISFDENGRVKVPLIIDQCNSLISKNKDEFGNWQIIKSNNINDSVPYSLKLDIDNEIFSGTHKIVFHKDFSKKLLKMELFSDSLYVIFSKGYSDFDSNINQMNELEELSWTTRPEQHK